MKCPKCGYDLRPTKINHEYNAGLPGVRVTLQDIPKLKCVVCGYEGVVIDSMESLRRGLKSAQEGDHVICRWNADRESWMFEFQAVTSW